jgi:hypothetical protein
MDITQIQYYWLHCYNKLLKYIHHNIVIIWSHNNVVQYIEIFAYIIQQKYDNKLIYY